MNVMLIQASILNWVSGRGWMDVNWQEQILYWEKGSDLELEGHAKDKATLCNSE